MPLNKHVEYAATRTPEGPSAGPPPLPFKAH